MANKKRKWIVKVPVTLHVCCEVKAPNKEAAIEAANSMCPEIECCYQGYYRPMDRPNSAIPATNDEDNTWFDPDSFDVCEIFLTDKVECQLIEGPGS